MRIAIMGGTFNPIHYAHLLSAEQVYDRLGFDKILFIPAARPPHKDRRDVIDSEHRYQMALLATSDNCHFEVSRIELERTGPSYAIQTVKELQTLYGSGSELAWIIGADSLIEFKIWKDFDELLDICHFIATTRQNYNLDNVPPTLRNRVEIFPITGVDISATEVRQYVRKGYSIRYLVPEAAMQYIAQHKLYK